MSSWSNRETQLAPYTAEREQQLKAIILRKTRPAFNNRFAKLLNGKHNHLVPKRNENLDVALEKVDTEGVKKLYLCESVGVPPERRA